MLRQGLEGKLFLNSCVHRFHSCHLDIAMELHSESREPLKTASTLKGMLANGKPCALATSRHLVLIGQLGVGLEEEVGQRDVVHVVKATRLVTFRGFGHLLQGPGQGLMEF